MKRLWLAALLPVAALAALIGLSGCGRSVDPWEGESGSPKVVVTIPPLYSFVKAVTGKSGAVRCICTTTGPHQYGTDRRDARLLQKADVLFAIGMGLDDQFSNPLVALVEKKDLQHVKLGDKLPEKLKIKEEHDHKEGDKEEHHGHEHGKHDPHVWLGIPQAIAMVEMIRDQLTEIDEDRKTTYKDNAADFIKVLKALKDNAPKGIAGKKIISFHESLEYFSDSFGVDIAGVIEVGPGAEPTSKHLAELRKLCKDKRIGVIAVEPQYPTSSSASILKEDLKKEIEIKLVPVDPMETADAEELKKEGADWYVKRMKQNLKELASALK